ncbi:MAG: alpha/beta hydrolase [Acidimicrobiia bacterium]
MKRVASSVLAMFVALSLVATACSSSSDNDELGAGNGSDSSVDKQESTSTTHDVSKPPRPSTTSVPSEDAIEWRSGVGPWERGTLEVPLDYTNPEGQQIELAMVRRLASEPNQRLGVLLLNPGGPGASGIEFAELSRFILSGELFDRFDVIGWDPRGVGESTPVTCGDDAFLDRYLAMDPVPETESDRAEAVALIEEFANNCVEESGYLLPFLGTQSSARDMDSIREALGESEINYLGFSYGTYLGASYLEMFPDRVRAMVLDGAYSRSLSDLEMTVGQASGFERSIQSFLAWCMEPRCDLAELGDPAEQLDGLLASLQQNPLPANGDRILTAGLAWTGVIMAMYVPAMWPMLDTALTRAIEHGDGQRLIELADQYNDRSPTGSYDNSTFAFTAISCADSPAESPEDEAAVAQAVMEAAPRVGPVFVSLPSPCDFFPMVDSDPPSGPFSVPDAPLVVVVATTGDPATPYQWGLRLWQELETSRILSVKGEDHTAYGSGNGCVDNRIDRYLLTLEFPERGMRC